MKALVHIRDNWKCRRCGATDQTLHAHHRVYNGDPWDAPFHELETVYQTCHEKHHQEKRTRATPEDIAAIEAERKALLGW